MRGTALRDALDFVSFNDFKNQIDYAQFGKAFNQYVDRTVLSRSAARCRWSGAASTVLGAFTLEAGDQPPLVTPARVDDWAGVMSEADDDDIILRLEGVSKVYSGTVAVKQADFDVRRGAVNVLVGENGAGKSTLMKIIAGVERPTHGPHPARRQAGRVLRRRRCGGARHRHGVPGTEPLRQSVGRREHFRRARDHARRARHRSRLQERRAGELLERLEAGIDPRTLVEDLRIGQQQLVEIAKAVAQDARILILDEPTSALSAAEVEILFRVIADLKARGVAIVYISHRLEELIRIGDFITVLRDGRVTGQRAHGQCRRAAGSCGR